MKNSKRYFVGIDLPKDVKDELKYIESAMLGAKWTKSDQYHLTIRFIGELDTELIEKLCEQLEKVEAERVPLTVEGVGQFPPKGEPKILWAGVEKDEALLNLKQIIEEQVNSIGFEKDKRNYTPHITLARLRRPRVRDIKEFVNVHSSLELPRYEVDSFHLYSSEMTEEGPVYKVEKSFRLK